jgi:hypothetical protein
MASLQRHENSQVEVGVSKAISQANLFKMTEQEDNMKNPLLTEQNSENDEAQGPVFES